MIKELDDESNIFATVELPLTEISDDAIDERAGCEQYECDVGGVINDAIISFEKLAYWHCGLRDQSGKIHDKQY